MAKKQYTDEEIRDALMQTGGVRNAAAKILGMSERWLRERLNEMDDIPPSPFSHHGNVYPVMPEGQRLKGVSSLQRVVDPETGETVMQWVKTVADPQQEEDRFRAMLDAMSSEAPRIDPVPSSLMGFDEDLASLYVLTDYHLGLMAWGEETGADWDLKIAEKLLIDWFAYAIEHAPDSKQAVLGQLGDFLHYDSLDTVTPASKHLLDSDTRPQKMIRTAFRVLRAIIKMLLEKHDNLHIIMAEGNHDPMSSAWLRETFAVLYENEPRVTVEVRPDPYYAYKWGKTAVLFHHGHMRRPRNVDTSLVRKFREIYGQCEFVYAHMGHMHHYKGEETDLMIVEQHPTLASADAYATRHGLMADRVAKVITYHKDFGEVGRLAITPQMVRRIK